MSTHCHNCQNECKSHDLYHFIVKFAQIVKYGKTFKKRDTSNEFGIPQFTISFGC